jgi:tRNA pseudouridine55 synthase
MALKPRVFILNKPPKKTSQSILYDLKRKLPKGFGKIGHFGTLDPFACGLFLVGISGAQRLNEFVHQEMPKTYLAIGKLGVLTDTGDPTGIITQKDESRYLQETIGSFDKEFIQSQIDSLVGIYQQSPHAYSAAKHFGRPLHEWAREGQIIEKPQKERTIYKLEVVKYVFPYLTIRATVSAGTYIRTLFTDVSQKLGTIGSLIALRREQIGHLHINQSLNPLTLGSDFYSQGLKMDEVLSYIKIHLTIEDQKIIQNGGFLKTELKPSLYWLMGDEEVIAMGEVKDGFLRPKINFQTLS